MYEEAAKRVIAAAPRVGGGLQVLELQREARISLEQVAARCRVLQAGQLVLPEGEQGAVRPQLDGQEAGQVDGQLHARHQGAQSVDGVGHSVIKLPLQGLIGQAEQQAVGSVLLVDVGLKGVAHQLSTTASAACSS
jgi:hypothetical protein